ncbi:hypothetical protein VSX61_20855 [Brenneria populi subsp. brevivirga]|uniref:Uncharacterized protein n=1 Tax=Pectobacterium betavasculorum TaxID=55207 RepID=A0A093RLU0_9GAMM|nr:MULTISPECIES: hypothetical protein [Pectobacteriaceae]KFW98780.1 hypothetical protein KP22_21145 [Pectobacterium betavasculorum]MEC5321357.1 hypothetical protein [Brenneria populi subsp. brevivirga]
MPKNVSGKSTTAVIYIGKNRYQELAKHAREISYLSDSNIRPSTFLHYLIDQFSDQAHTELLKQLLAEKQKE